MKEEWRPVVGLEGLYEVSNLGQIRNWKGYVLKIRTNKYGYESIGLYADGKKLYPMVHRLVARAFIANPESKPQINHLDAIRTNNKVGNLEWATHSENMRHAFILGNKDQKGSKNNGAKLTEEAVQEIRERAKTTLQKTIAKEYGLSKANVCLIVNRVTWKHI